MQARLHALEPGPEMEADGGPDFNKVVVEDVPEG